jgi:ElaB/YqjD/DUF883 family membrane-anchored ribosome-binding protein
MAARFVEDPRFRDNIYRASNRSRSSLRPLYDQVRQLTDRVAEIAKNDLAKLADTAQSEVEGARKKIHADKSVVSDFRRAKARAFALKTAQNSTFPTMGYDGNSIYGRVIINRRGSATVEYGGIDPVAEIGKGTGEYVQHPAYGVLRNALRKL